MSAIWVSNAREALQPARVESELHLGFGPRSGVSRAAQECAPVNACGRQGKRIGFSQMTGWTELRELDLTSTPVTDEGMLHIGKMMALERLLLAYSDVTDEG